MSDNNFLICPPMMNQVAQSNKVEYCFQNQTKRMVICAYHNDVCIFTSFIGWILYNICYLVQIQITVHSRGKRRCLIVWKIVGGKKMNL